ncbi:MAG: hypothetical protein ABIB11_01975 [Candidatus Omnitrophota bacterium]
MLEEDFIKIICEMFYDYDDPSIQKGAQECIKELIGEGWRQDSPYLKAYILRKILGDKLGRMFVIRYGEKGTQRPKYYFTVPELFFSEEEANKLARHPSEKYAKIVGLPYCVEEI